MRRNLTSDSLSPAQIKKFWSLIDRSDPDGCWPFHGHVMKEGYGRIQFNHVRILAHRLAYILTYGDIDPDLNVLHQCDNPPCCNPAHHFLGTQLDNIADRVAKQRTRGFVLNRGERNAKARFTADDVRDIRSRYAAGQPVVALAEEYGVWPTTVWAVVYRHTWRHVE